MLFSGVPEGPSGSVHRRIQLGPAGTPLKKAGKSSRHWSGWPSSKQVFNQTNNKQSHQSTYMEIKNPKLLYLKAGLFVISGLLSSAAILMLVPNLRIAALLLIAIWSFARAYYFAFYVVEHYVDPGYRFAGLWSFVRYVARRR